MSLLVFPDYFADHMGDYEDVLASLETLNLSILKAMDYTKRVSPPDCAVCSTGSGQTVQMLSEHLSPKASSRSAVLSPRAGAFVR